MMRQSIGQRQRGLTLIELLVAMTLSIILLTGVIQVFSSNKKMFVFQNGVSSVQDSGRYAALTFGYQLRLSGFVENAGQRLWDQQCLTQKGLVQCVAVEGVEDDPTRYGDGITIRYQGGVDCLGNSNIPSKIVQNEFYVKDDDNGVPSLFCQGNSLDAAGVLMPEQAIISNIERMEILYGIDQDFNDVADRYIRYSDIANGRFKNKDIVSVEIGVMVTSNHAVRSKKDTQTFALPGATWQPSDYNNGDSNNDRLLRKMFSSIYTLRNRVNNGSIPK